MYGSTTVLLVLVDVIKLISSLVRLVFLFVCVYACTLFLTVFL